MCDASHPSVVLLAGGVGGARLAAGLQRVVPAAALTIVVNIGDDDDFHGLRVCPDLDTVLYTLSGQINKKQAWGIEGDGTRALAMLKQLGAPDTWMTLGDADLGVHLFRTARLNAGASLTEVIGEMAQAFGIAARVLPASNARMSTRIDVDGATLRFQEWFVKERCEPQVRQLRFDGAAEAEVTPEVAAAIKQANVIIFAPSNPLLSILPMLQIEGIDALIRDSHATKVVVSPLINGQAVKGPLDRLMRDLRFSAGSAGIAEFYRGTIDGIVIDQSDRDDEHALAAGGLRVLLAPTRIPDASSASELVQRLLAWVGTWRTAGAAA